MLGNGAVLRVGVALRPVIRRGRMGAMIAPRGPDEELEAAGVEDAGDHLVAYLEVAEVLHILKIVQLLAIRLRHSHRVVVRRRFAVTPAGLYGGGFATRGDPKRRQQMAKRSSIHGGGTAPKL